MNKIYRLKFSKRLNALVAVSELTRGCDHSTEKGSEKPARMKVRHLALKPLSAILLSLGVTSIPQSVLASGLQGMDVVHGTATMQVDGNKTIIRNSVDAIINWKQFNINQNEMVQFLQENNNSAVFNRVTSNQISQLKGILDSNGQVFLINPNGITIGKDAIINTNGFTASTLDISNENIKARNFTFEQTKDKALAEIVNHGLITVGKDGSVNLIGGKVKNEGVISVNGGSISLLAGQKITISDIINPTITYSIAAPENEAVNLGEIFAKGGNINIRAANIRNQGKLSADSVSKDKSGNIILSAKEGEAEIGGVISAQNQQAKGGKLMITGDKVTLKTGAVIDLSGKEGGETYLGGDERGEGKNGIQLAKKTSLEKGSTINVSGKEKGGRAIVWGDIALIDGNINARGGGDIAKTGGFVETSGHDLFIKDNTTVDAKEWLLDPDNVSIDAQTSGRNNISEDEEYTGIGDSINNPKINNPTKKTLTNSTLETILQRGTFVNITASKNIYVNSSINIGANGHLILHSEGRSSGGVQINKDITSTGGNLTINSKGWVDIHKNITLGEGFLNITAGGSVAFEGKNDGKSRSVADAQVIAQGTITSGSGKGFRFNNVSLNGTGKGLLFTNKKNSSASWKVNGIENKFEGDLNISGKVNVSIDVSGTKWYSRVNGRTYWNVSTLNVSSNSNFSLSIDTSGTNSGKVSETKYKDLNGIIFNNNNAFNVKKGSTVNFSVKASILTPEGNSNYALFNGNISVSGGGNVNFKLDAPSSTFATSGVIINSKNFNVSGGSSLNLESAGSTKTAFSIRNDLTLNATGGNILLRQVEGTDSKIGNGIVAEKNITFDGGNITFGSQKAPTEIKGNVTVKQGANVTLRSANFHHHKGALTVKGNITANGNLTADGDTIEITGNLTVGKGAKFNGNTKNNLNITGNFTNNGATEINITQGVVNLGNITNDGELNITTHAQNKQRSVINGDIINKKGGLNITDNNSNAEIQIGGNISQKEGNLTISSDKINITKQITIKKGIDGEDSSSDATSNANLTIKTKELKLVNDLNISGFNKAEITAKNNGDLAIGDASSTDGANTKKVTFNNVKDSKISADNHKVTLNSKVETSGNDSNSESGSSDNPGLTIDAKDVAVNNNITSHKTVNISAANGEITTKAGTTINATTGNVEITAQTGGIQGGIESKLGNANITANGNTLTVNNVTGQNVTVTASSGTVTTTVDSTINATTGNASITTGTGNINGKVESSFGSVTLTATGDALTVSNVTAKNDVTVKAETGKLTTTSGGTIKSEESKVELTAQSGLIDGNVEGKNQVNVTASTGSLTIKNGAKVDATNGAATLTAESGKLTTQTGSSITSSKGEATLTANN
ncbi:adhesin, partial [Haemophilus influenzae]|uniref:two-partner secretion domain-containing protein n=1 Tax=Haemophilus influenzae TaxID=727 RepID=UPI000A0C71CC